MSMRMLAASRRARKALGLAAAAVTLATLPGPGRAEDVNVTANTNSGLNLDSFAGTTVRVFPGITLANTGTLIGASFSGVAATTRAWTLTNDGTIEAQLGNAIRFQMGGIVNNNGAIISGFQGIALTGAGGTVNNAAGALIDAGSNGVFINNGIGMVTNAGTIRSSVEAVGLRVGGTLINQAGGLIEGINVPNAVSIIGGTTRVVVNDGIIRNTNANAGQFPAGVAIAGGNVTNNLSGQIIATYNAIWAHTAATAITNHGLLQANAASGSTIEINVGGTVVNTGMITNAGDGILFQGTGTITNTGTIESTGAGRAIVFSGNVLHTLILGTGSVLTGNVQGGTGTDALVLQGTGSETISKFLSFQTLTMQGAIWTLNGASTFSTTSTVESGILRVSGTLTSPLVTVQNLGTLSGAGTIVGNVVNAGTIAPGASIGTLNITGALTFNAGSNYDVEVDANGTGDRTIATGTATLQGGTVRVLANFGNFAPSTVYTILTAAGGVTGTFAGITSNFAFLTPTLTYDANNVYLTLALNALDFSGVAHTRNQFAAGRVTGVFGPGNPIWDALVLLDDNAGRAALDALSGELHASLKTALFEDAQHLRETLLARIRQAFGDQAFAGGAAATLLAEAAASDGPDPRAPERRFGVWMQGYGVLGRTEGDENAGTLTRSVRGFFAGVDLPFGERFTAGLAFGYGRGALDLDARASSATIDSYHIAAYGGARFGPLGLRAGFGFAWHDIDTQRGIAFPGFADRVKASYGARTWQLFGEAGYTLGTGAVALEPFAGLAYVGVAADDFQETGGAAALNGRGRSKSLVFSTLGVRAATRWAISDMRTLTLRGALGWRHAFGAVTPETDLAFNSPANSPFGAAGVPVARDSLAVDAGASLALGSRWSVNFTYSGQIASRAHSHRLAGKAVWRF
jgi:outer membrane autotransporter protein